MNKKYQNIAAIKDNVILRLKNAGFHILYYASITTNSHYIKIDYGLCNSLRIADHKGKKKLAYRYNLRVDLRGFHIDNSKKWEQYIYGIDQIDQLIIDIKKRRITKRMYLTPYEYRDKMQHLKNRMGKEKGFWKNCIVV